MSFSDEAPMMVRMKGPHHRTVSLACLVPIIIVIGSLIMTSAGPAPADEPNDSQHSRRLKAISYNVQFLPGVAAVANKRPNAPYRARVLGDRLAAWDIVGLNEAFDAAARDQILKGLKSAWKGAFTVVTGPPPTDPTRFNGGLVIATRLPILEQHSVIYTKFSRPEDFGLRADGFASKGVLHARIQLSAHSSVTDFIDVFVTHMEARDDSIRPFQYEEMAGFIRLHAAEDHPTLIMGDFNTRGNPEYQADPESPYNLLMTTLAEALPDKHLKDLWPTMHGDAIGGTSEQESSDIGRRIDYIMLAVPENQPDFIRVDDVRVNPFLDEKVTALSDHSAVEADLSFFGRATDP